LSVADLYMLCTVVSTSFCGTCFRCWQASQNLQRETRTSQLQCATRSIYR